MSHSAPLSRRLWSSGVATFLVVGAFFVSCRPPTEKVDYTQFNKGKLALRAVLSPVWRKRLTRHTYSPTRPEEFAGAEVSPDGETVWIGSSAKVLWALSKKTGTSLWKKDLPAPILAPPLYVAPRQRLYLGLADGCLYAIKTKNAEIDWKYCAKGLIYRRPAYRHGVVYFTNTQNYLYAIDAETGKWRWSYDRALPEGFGIQGHAGPLVEGDRLYTGFADGYLVSLDARSGDVHWSRSLKGDAAEYVDVDSTPVLHDGVVYASSQAGGVHALTADMGALKWQYKTRGATGVALSGDRVYFVSARKGIHCLTLEGKLVWRQDLDAGPVTKPWIHKDLVIFNTGRKGTYFINKKTGEYINRFNPGFGASAPITFDDDHFFLFDNGGTFHHMRLH